MGTTLAPILFAIALIAAGQSSTITGTLAGQIVMEGYLNLRIQPWARRIITRSLAIIPAVVAITIFGESVTGQMLILSQVVLSLQLGFAIIPLIYFVSDKKRMGKLAIGTMVKIMSWLCAAIIVALNIKLVVDELLAWLSNAQSPVVLWLTVVPLAVGALFLLAYVTVTPLIKEAMREPILSPHAAQAVIPDFNRSRFQRIAIAVDFSKMDEATFKSAFCVGNRTSKYLLIHVVESAGALVLGKDIQDKEAIDDEERLEFYAAQLRAKGFNVAIHLGFGNPKNSIPQAVNDFEADLLVLGAHGHRFFKDLIFGTTVDSVRHSVNIPVFIVRD